MLGGLLSARIARAHAGLNARIDDLRADLRDMRNTMEMFDE